jgi:hypothetical protein
MGDEVIRVARASRAVSVVPRSRTLHFANLSISEMTSRLIDEAIKQFDRLERRP